eukprot:16430774-Heterocapsa_arctica.AAC.1
MCSIGGVTIIGMGRESLQFVGVACAAMLVLAWTIGFIMGASRGNQTGFPHLDACISYLRIHVFNRKAAME